MEEKEYRFGQPERPEDKPLTDYEEAPEWVSKLAKKLINQYHQHMKNARISYLQYKKDLVYRGLSVPGRLYKLTNREKAEFKVDFMLVINEEIWDSEMYRDEKIREAAMDWILCFGMKKLDGGFKLDEPDFYGFYRNIQRYGLWNRPLQRIEDTIRQQKLPFGEEAS